jgi:filamentous hemagglutinin family protein
MPVMRTSGCEFVSRAASDAGRVLLLACLTLGFSPRIAAQVVLDGSLGRGGAVAGPGFAITADLGRRAGANLFHSFSQFNLANGQVATFSGPAEVANVISRVTGGASSIDGVLRSTIDGASFFLFNPAGVAFGPHAAIDVGGAFHVSSAHAIRLADGSRFDAANPAASTLGTAPPESFGFLGGQGAVSFTGSRLATRTGSALLVAGGNIHLREGASLKAPSADLGLASVTGAGEVTFGAGRIAAVSGARGDILLTDGIAYTDGTGGRPAGPVRIVGGRIVLAGESTVSASTLADGAGGTIGIDADELAVVDDSRIMAVTWSSGDAGSIRIEAGHGVRVEDRGAITAQSQGTGAAGDIAVRADTLTVVDGYLGTTAFHSGRGGSIAVDVGELFLDGGYITTNSSRTGSGDAGSLAVRASRGIRIVGYFAGLSATTAEGRGGSIVVETPSLALERGGHVNTLTTGSGDAGTIALRTGELRLGDLAYISASAGPEATGRGGGIAIHAGSVSLASNAQILSTTSGAGRGGDILVSAPRIAVDGNSRVSAAANAGGRGGSIVIETGELSLTGLGYLDVSSRGSGAGGDLTVNATGVVSLSGNEGNYASGLFAMARGTGAGGSITVRAPRVVVDGAVITATTLGPGRGGPILIEAGDLLLRGGALVISNAVGTGAAGDVVVNATGSVTAAGTGGPGMSGLYAETTGAGDGGRIVVAAPRLTLDDGAILSARSGGSGAAGSISLAVSDSLVVSSRAGIETQTLHADGGDIAIEGGGLVYLHGGVISTSVHGGAGNGGNITIAKPLHVVLNDGTVSANAYGGDGGNIAIDSSHFIASPGSIMEASSQLGVSGTVTVTAPSADIGAGLGALPASFFDASRLLRETCASRAGESENSFVAVGRGALPESAWGALSSPGAREEPDRREEAVALPRRHAASSCGGLSK